MKIPIRLRPFLHTAKAVPRRLFQSVLAVWLLGGAMGASFAGECDAVYSVVEGYGKLSVPCIQLDDGIVYQAQLDQVRGAKQFLFELKTTSLVNPPAGLYASFDNGTVALPVVETNLGGKQKFYTVQLVKQGQSEAGNLIFGFTSLPKGLNAQNPIPADLSSYAKGEKVSPGQAKKIAHQGAELEIGAGAVSEETTLQIKSLAEADIPPLPAGMINVTKGQRKGFRFLPHGMKFNKKIKLKLPYDKKHLPAGYSEQDIHTYYHDDQAKQWKRVERVAVDTGKQEIISQTDHFSDYANAASCLAKIVFVTDEHLPDFVEAGQSVTLTWKVKNTSTCDAVNYRMGFYSSSPSSSSNFGGSSHPTFTINAGATDWIRAEFISC